MKLTDQIFVRLSPGRTATVQFTSNVLLLLPKKNVMIGEKMSLFFVQVCFVRFEGAFAINFEKGFLRAQSCNVIRYLFL